jgi:serine/threonine protein kinase
MVTPGPGPLDATRSAYAARASALPGPTGPDRIGDYTVLRPLGGGAMGAVYLVVRDGADRARVLKRVAVRQPEYRAALKSEAVVLLAFRHPNIARVEDAKFAPADASDDDYIVLEHVAGVDVSRLMAALGRIDAELTAYVGLEIARGLFAAHTLPFSSDRVGIIHRDVKPANVMLGFEGEVKLIDFGVATLRDVASAGTEGQPEGFTGTLEYASQDAALDASEQKKVDYDIYALGLVLRDMLAGPRPAPPPTCVTFIEELAFLAKRELWPSMSHVDPELATLVERLTHRYPRERLTDLRQVIPWLESILARLSRARVAAGGSVESPRQRLGATIRERFAEAWQAWGDVARRIEDIRLARFQAHADKLARNQARASVPPSGAQAAAAPVRPSAPPVAAPLVAPVVPPVVAPVVAPLVALVAPVVDDHTTPLEPVSAAQVRAAHDAAVASDDVISSPPAPVGARERAEVVDVLRAPRRAQAAAPGPLVAPLIPGEDGHTPPTPAQDRERGARLDAAQPLRAAMTEQLPGRRGRALVAPEPEVDDAPPRAPQPAPATLPDEAAVSRSSLGIPGATHLGVPGEPNPPPQAFAGVERVGDYHCLEKLAEGGHGVIYLAVREGGTEPVVVKTMRPSLDGQDLAVQRFLREWKITAQLPHHRHLGHLVDSKLVTREVGAEAESRIQVFRYLPSLEVEHAHLTALRRGHLLPHRVSFAVAVDALAGLAAAHAATGPRGEPLNLFHRDLSPRNILLGFDGYAQVIDFGVAHAEVDTFKTNPGYVMGTLRYSSPELLRGEAGDQRSDIYAIGVVLIELLSGEDLVPRVIRGLDGRPREPTAPELLAWGREVDARRIRCPDKIPPMLWGALLRALEPRPERRWRSAEEFRNALVHSTPEWAEEIEDRTRIARTLAKLFPTEHADASARTGRVAEFVAATRAPRPALPATRTAHVGLAPAPLVGSGPMRDEGTPIPGSGRAGRLIRPEPEAAPNPRAGVGSGGVAPVPAAPGAQGPWANAAYAPVASGPAALGPAAPIEARADAARPRAASYVAVAPAASAPTRAAPGARSDAAAAAPPPPDVPRSPSVPTDPPAGGPGVAPQPERPGRLTVPTLEPGAAGRVTDPASVVPPKPSLSAMRAHQEVEAAEGAGDSTRTEFRGELGRAPNIGVVLDDRTDGDPASLLSVPPLVYGAASALGAPTLPPLQPAPTGLAAWPAPLRWSLVAALGAIVFAAVVAIVGGERDVVVLPPPPATSAAPTSVGAPEAAPPLAAPELEPAARGEEPSKPASERDPSVAAPTAERAPAPPIPPARSPASRPDVERSAAPTRRAASKGGTARAAPAPEPSSAANAAPTPSPSSSPATAQPARGDSSAGPEECRADNLDRLIEATKLDAARASDPLKTRVLALCAQAYMLRDCDRLRRAKGLLSTGMLAPGP